jgi:Tfp pilus assembly protein PilW
MMRIETGVWATMGFAAFLFGSSACAQADARDRSTNRATESPERSAMSNPTPSANPAATTMSSASPAEVPTAAAGDPAKAGEIQGRIERVGKANSLTIAGSESAGLAFDQFKVDSSTDVTIGDAKASINDVNPGDEVRASFSGTGDTLHVDRLQILPPAGAEPSAQGTSSGRDEKDSSSSSPNKNP